MIKNSEGVVEALENAAKAQAAQNLLEEQWSEYVDRIGQRGVLEAAKEAAEENAELALTEYENAKKIYDNMSDSMGLFIIFSHEASVFDAAKEQLDTYNGALDETTDAYGENEAAISDLEEAFQLFEEQSAAAEEAAGNQAEITAAIDETKASISELIVAYDEAYDSALQSVQGQYDLWDETAKVVATNVGDINSNIDDQTTYWQNYNANLASLSDRAEDIEGLATVIASFADGSKESVNAIAGMASASDEDLTEMVNKWTALQEEQETTAGSLAELETDFSNTMATLLQDLNDTVTELDMSGEAAGAAISTVEAYINNIEDQAEGAYKAAQAVAQAAKNGFSSITGGGVSVTVNGKSTTGYATGTKSADPGWAWVGEYGPELMYMQGGETILPSEVSMAYAEEMYQAASLNRTIPNIFFAYPSAQGARNNTISASISDRSGFSGITINPQYNITVGSAADANELRETVSQMHNDLGNMIIEKIEDYYADKERSAYS